MYETCTSPKLHNDACWLYRIRNCLPYVVNLTNRTFLHEREAVSIKSFIQCCNCSQCILSFKGIYCSNKSQTFGFDFILLDHVVYKLLKIVDVKLNLYAMMSSQQLRGRSPKPVIMDEIVNECAIRYGRRITFLDKWINMRMMTFFVP